MSIPPLVCSTPPPPDQCEDDKDPEDFDLSYSLSQDDDDDDDENNGYNYGNLSSYNNFQATPNIKPVENKEPEIIENIGSEVPKEIFIIDENTTEHNSDSHIVFGTNDINENQLKCDDDVNIEDLNLKVDEEIESIVGGSNTQVESNEANVASLKDFDIPCSFNNDSPSCDNTNVSSFDDNLADSVETLKELNSDLVETEEIQVEVTKDNLDVGDANTVVENVSCSPIELHESPHLQESLTRPQLKTEVFEEPYHHETKSEETMFDDDFDDFQSVNAKSNVTSVFEKIDNPWDNTDSNESDFGNFTANFEESKPNTTDERQSLENVSDVCKVQQFNSEIQEVDNKSDDDFGDFDDFQSSSVKHDLSELPIEDLSDCPELPVFNLQSTENEHQIMERITKVLSSVFLEEISQPDSEFEGKLESLLSETWGHLMQTDERQPYIVNWNNSLGQKTLLRALCIDSRNILFGPKWSSSMPKYAANLSNAPLQPQKQASIPPSIVSQNEVVAEKSSGKTTTWNDPFTSDGQESCNTDNESSNITPRPTDLDVFEGAVSTKSDKIYSNTIGVQPLRQINLPDTHIFTPTNSEIPRSKTIHYDSGPTVLLPQPAVTENKNQTDTVSIVNTNSALETDPDDNEYWEFQNFKSTSDTSSLPGNTNNSQEQVTSQGKEFEVAKTINALPKPNIAYQTELLQPIRVEPSMPTLNWPNPGDVQGVAFDDFSDFVSIPVQPNEGQDSSIQSAETQAETIQQNKLETFHAFGVKNEVSSENTSAGNNDLDDDFDTFQSAQPPTFKEADDAFTSSFMGNQNKQVSNHNTDFENGSPQFNSIKSDTISFGSIHRPNEALTQHVGYISNTSEQTIKSPLSSGMPIQTNVLQPTTANFSAVNMHNQQKSAQILQPLSLESYSQINWPSPGIDLQDLSRFNPVETLNSLKSELSVSGLSKVASPAHTAKNTSVSQGPDDDVWGEFVSSKPKPQPQSQPKKPSVFVDDDEWTDFISSPSVKPQNGLNTISLNVHTNSNIQKSVQSKFTKKSNQPPIDIPTLNYITPKTNPAKFYNDKHFQNL